MRAVEVEFCFSCFFYYQWLVWFHRLQFSGWGNSSFSCLSSKFSGILFCWLRSEKLAFKCHQIYCYWKTSMYIVYICENYCFSCWSSIRECQSSDSSAARIANFFLSTMFMGRLGNFPQESFPVFYKNWSAIDVI